VADARASVRALTLKDFRNFERLELEIPAPGLALVGDNGQGKSNLLESLYYLSLLRSVRGARDADVTRFGAAGFFVEASICAPSAKQVAVGFERASRRKRVRVDGAPLERLSDALGSLPAVMFSPADVDLVAGAPSARRRYLDIMLAVTSRGYLEALQQYRGALERRNAALRDAARQARGNTAAIEVWEPPLAEYGAHLVRMRRAWVAQYADTFADRSRAIGERGSIELRYETSVNPNAESLELALAEALVAKRGTDLRLGLTHVGPHRDDLGLLLDGHELRTFGSAGQQRTAAIALRTLEAETLRDARGAAPVFLLDDPFAELDAARSARVLGMLRDVGLAGGQTILAVPRESDIPGELTDLPQRGVVNGTVT
jgi:DNA replication and repair protein RecF